MHHVFKLKKNRLSNSDFNIDQNNRDHDFFHNLAVLGHTVLNAMAKAPRLEVTAFVGLLVLPHKMAPGMTQSPIPDTNWPSWV